MSSHLELFYWCNQSIIIINMIKHKSFTKLHQNLRCQTVQYYNFLKHTTFAPDKLFQTGPVLHFKELLLMLLSGKIKELAADILSYKIIFDYRPRTANRGKTVALTCLMSSWFSLFLPLSRHPIWCIALALRHNIQSIQLEFVKLKIFYKSFIFSNLQPIRFCLYK